MAITVVGAGTAGATSIAFATHQVGDLIVFFAYRDGSTTVPTQPSGQNWTIFHNSSGANTNSHRISYKVATSTSEASGTWTNATGVGYIILRGDNAITVGSVTNAIGAGTGGTITYPALALDNTDNTSRVIAFAGHRNTDGSLPAPSGMGQQATSQTNSNELAVHITTGTVSSWTAQTTSWGGTNSGWRTHMVEIEESVPPSPSPTPTPTPTPSVTPSVSPSPTPSPSVTPSSTPSATPTPSVTPSVSPSPTPSVTPTPSPSPSMVVSGVGVSIRIDINGTLQFQHGSVSYIARGATLTGTLPTGHIQVSGTTLLYQGVDGILRGLQGTVHTTSTYPSGVVWVVGSDLHWVNDGIVYVYPLTRV
jgi:hypothetical protein